MTGIIFLAAFFTGCIMALARHPIFGLLTYIAVFYLHPPVRWWGKSLPDLRWALLSAAITLLAVAVHSKKWKPAIPLLGHGYFIGLVMFTVWLGIQSLWALDQPLHQEFLSMYVKFALLVGLIYRCVDCEKHLRYFLWAHVLGCVYLGWIAFTTYQGGRFEGFDSPGLNEANSGALQIVTAIFTAAALFLAGSMRERAALIACVGILANALVTTISRSGFLAVTCGGIIFNFFTPTKFRTLVRILSAIGVVAFLSLTTDTYWERIESIKHTGEQVQGMDTGSGRLDIMKIQVVMFANYPMGCGHRCTAVLSPFYMDDKMLTGVGDQRQRSSHNSFMSLLVEQGVIGATLYILMLFWLWKSVWKLVRRYKNENTFMAALTATMASVLAAITIGDLFVDYLRLEVRLWFIGVLMAMLNLTAHSSAATATNANTVKPPVERRPLAIR